MDTRKEILDTALDLFSKKGYYGTSIREIAEHVGIQKSSIYNHFNSKEDILINLFNYYGPLYLKKRLITEKMQGLVSNPKKFFKEYITEVINFFEYSNGIKFFQIMLLEHNNEFVREKIKEDYLMRDRETLVEVFREMIDKGLIIEEDPYILANEFIGPVVYFCIQHLLSKIVGEDVSYIYEQMKKHAEFFYNAVSKEY